MTEEDLSLIEADPDNAIVAIPKLCEEVRWLRGALSVLTRVTTEHRVELARKTLKGER